MIHFSGNPEALTASCFVRGADLSEFQKEFLKVAEHRCAYMWIDAAKLPSAFVKPAPLRQKLKPFLKSVGQQLFWKPRSLFYHLLGSD